MPQVDVCIISHIFVEKHVLVARDSVEDVFENPFLCELCPTFRADPAVAQSVRSRRECRPALMPEQNQILAVLSDESIAAVFCILPEHRLSLIRHRSRCKFISAGKQGEQRQYCLGRRVTLRVVPACCTCERFDLRTRKTSAGVLDYQLDCIVKTSFGLLNSEYSVTDYCADVIKIQVRCIVEKPCCNFRDSHFERQDSSAGRLHRSDVRIEVRI